MPDIKSERIAVQPGKPDSKWLFGIPIIAMVATVLLFAGLLRHRSSPQVSESGAAQSNAATPAPTQTAKRPSGHKENHSVQGKLRTGSATSPVVGDRIVHQAVPSVPEKALRTIRGRVRVNVKAMIDSSGNVTRVELASAGPSRYFANLALQAARDWKFSEGPGERMRLLQFVFENSGVTADERQL
jgi:TonB family protein